MSKGIACRPLTLRVQSVADLPDPDTLAAIVDEAAAADPAKVRDLLTDPEAELDIWRHTHGWTVWLADRVIARVGAEDAPIAAVPAPEPVR